MKKRVDRFILRDLISESGGGALYLGEEQLPGDITRPVAVKLLPVLREGDRAGQERFLFEVRALAALGQHPNLVTVFGIGLTEGLPWIAMEYLPRSAADLLSEAPAPAAMVSKLISDVARGLSVMHHLQPPLLHNDLKPANILLDALGTHKLADFGLASLVAQDRTRPMATVHYAAPELLSREFGKTAPATDLYALGHIAYELALGGKIYRPQFPAVYEDVRGHKEPPPQRWMSWHSSINTNAKPVAEVRSDFPSPLSDIIAKLMAKPLADRYVSADEVLAELENKDEGGRGKDEALSSSLIPHSSSLPTPPPVSVAPPTPEEPDSMHYWVRFRGQIAGPFDIAALKAQARKGALSRLHQVSTDKVTWKSANSLPGVS